MNMTLLRRKGYVFTVLKTVGLLLVVVLLLALGSRAADAADRKPAVDESAMAKTRKFEGLRAMRYCEIFLIHADPKVGLRGEVFNTSGLNGSDPLDSCPADLWEKVDVEALKAEYKLLGVFKNGPRHWVNDWIELPAAEVGTLSGLQVRWFMHVDLPKDFGKAGATYYKPTIGRRNSSMTFEKGKPVFILDDPDGMPWVLQAFTTLIEPNLTYDTLKDLGSKLKLPEGWKFRVKVLEEDLTIEAVNGNAWIVQDDLQGTYDACFEEDGQKACSFQP